MQFPNFCRLFSKMPSFSCLFYHFGVQQTSRARHLAPGIHRGFEHRGRTNTWSVPRINLGTDVHRTFLTFTCCVQLRVQISVFPKLLSRMLHANRQRCKVRTCRKSKDNERWQESLLCQMCCPRALIHGPAGRP